MTLCKAFCMHLQLMIKYVMWILIVNFCKHFVPSGHAFWSLHGYVLTYELYFSLWCNVSGLDGLMDEKAMIKRKECTILQFKIIYSDLPRSKTLHLRWDTTTKISPNWEICAEWCLPPQTANKQKKNTFSILCANTTLSSVPNEQTLQTLFSHFCRWLVVFVQQIYVQWITHSQGMMVGTKDVWIATIWLLISERTTV